MLLAGLEPATRAFKRSDLLRLLDFTASDNRGLQTLLNYFSNRSRPSATKLYTYRSQKLLVECKPVFKQSQV
jgi:hypothetical protein